jgi:hypothetical protein
LRLCGAPRLRRRLRYPEALDATRMNGTEP